MGEDDIRGIHSQRVTAWFQDHIEGVKPPLEFSRIVGGPSSGYRLVVMACLARC